MAERPVGGENTRWVSDCLAVVTGIGTARGRGDRSPDVVWVR